MGEELMWVSRSWWPALMGLLLTAGTTYAGPAFPRPRESVGTLIVDPPRTTAVRGLADKSDIDAMRDRELVLAPSMPFVPASVQETYAAPVLNGMPANEPVAKTVSTEPLTVPITPFGAAGLMGLSGMMYWLGTRWLRIKA